MKKEGDNFSTMELRTTCSICHRPVYDNVRTDRIITCGGCVQALLLLSQQNKVVLRDKLFARENHEGARSVESFLDWEEETVKVSFHPTQRKEKHYGR